MATQEWEAFGSDGFSGSPQLLPRHLQLGPQFQGFKYGRDYHDESKEVHAIKEGKDEWFTIVVRKFHYEPFTVLPDAPARRTGRAVRGHGGKPNGGNHGRLRVTNKGC